MTVTVIGMSDLVHTAIFPYRIPSPTESRSGAGGSSNAWPAGQLLAMSGLAGTTDFSDGLVARTAEQERIQLLHPYGGEIAIAMPGKRVEWGGDYLVSRDPSNGFMLVFLDAHHILIRGKCDIDLSDTDYQVVRKGQCALLGVASHYRPELIDTDLEVILCARSAWIDNLPLPDLDEPSAAEALRKAVLMCRTQVMSAEGPLIRRWSTPDRWPHRRMWLWDSVFHAIGWRHYDLDLARDILHAVLDMQREDGFIPHAADPVNVSDITQPPVLAFGVSQLLEVGVDLEWIDQVYPKLVAYLQWNERHRDTDGNGLLEWFIEDLETCRSGESGMDNSPRFDGACQLDAVDFNSFMAQEYRVLADFAERLGYSEDAVSHRRRWQEYCNLINHFLWNPETGFYHDFDPASGGQTSVLASSGFLPLFCGAASPEQAQRIVQHLADPGTFGTALPVPSVARCSRQGGEKDMWRGPVWININWLIEYSLQAYGFHNEARQLRQKTCRTLIDEHEQYGTFFEFYDDEGLVPPPLLDRKGCNAPDVSPFHQVIFEFGWSASLFIDWVYRSVDQ